ncbi:hypothetical protein FAZ95_06240 [Trinickia violacea]|uniref:Uncharacterized protein n=1 Tax=Trinickia violacea TaxID=2571746 RepID=A0A4P8ILP4_9BURK|nr:hypothetical protein [Trinickia violacea]QCP48821.1 hypothetical protein FAZ95_06240 [Trinickia violacea]
MCPFPSLRVLPAACAALLLVSLNASAQSNGKPLVLDTESGINDGQSGLVLQTAPLSRQPMVAAKPTATPSELQPDSSQPIVVAPYINLPVGGASAPRPVYRPKSSQ